ncbi:U4/U6-U5 snRNP complex subunit prp31 [Boothiomyces macroporosus]|uniref:U4/U6-U5 snRNP complex subunit prp31 n=1 Tax=Boothiomyces macroporosus TaxID=261099 RepID=A0AAD5UJW1_9FUNG|nr:U4/U6-U5 snRNP complex subunit prp31 [Boothiomyces macroporosus]
MDEDDLLEDLEDLGEDEQEFQDGEELEAEQEEMQHDEYSLEAITKVHKSKQLITTLEKIKDLKDTKIVLNSALESHSEYNLIVQANALTAELAHEITAVNNYIKDHYNPCFPELSQIILNPITYAKAVKIIGNNMDLTKVDLKSILSSHDVMAVTVTATTTAGSPISQEELELIYTACDTALEMDIQQKTLLEYVASRMTVVAPNLTVLLGSAVAAKMMGFAGGLNLLAKIPACNLLVLGHQKKGMIGMSTVSMGNHEGFIYDCDLVRDTPKHIRRKAARLLSAKCALAARIDMGREYEDGSMGRSYRDDVQKKINLLVEPPPAKKTKALPLPIEYKKKRGGKRARREKERNAQSELSKAANRMAFGEAEDEVGFSTGESFGLGMIGKATGKIRAPQINTAYKVSKKHKAMQKFSTNTNGLASSVAFTPVKGIELENPDRLKKIAEVNNKYFGELKFKKKE